MAISGGVHPLTLNQRVQGSNPCAPTNEINTLDEISITFAGPVRRQRLWDQIGDLSNGVLNAAES
jgi:hypothetical protein